MVRSLKSSAGIRRRLKVLGAAFLLLAVGQIWSRGALSETVKLLQAGPMSGHGYMFLDTDKICRVVTAAHVVMSERGKLLDSVKVLDRFGREFRGETIVQPDRDLDLAFLEVRTGEGPDALCTRSRLGIDRLDNRLTSFREGFLATTDPSGEQLNIRIETRAVAMDEKGGTTFAIAPVRSAVAINQGMSGSPVMDEDQPLGLLIQAPIGFGLALRFDVIKSTFRAWRASAAYGSASATERDAPVAVSLPAQIRSLEGNPTDALEGRPWRIRLNARFMDLHLRFPTPRAVASVRAEFGDTMERVSVDVAQRQEGGREGDFSYVRTCAPESLGQTVHCRLSLGHAVELRLRLILPRPGPLTIRRITVE